ncbi:MAG: fluoride efflux transporter CrcB [Clostridiales bacterium]|nr:fluoride efflux transporter CrcB [Clostridiales bacterium]
MGMLFVGLGGFLGACSRFLLTRACGRMAPAFPLGTLLSNVIAGLLIGLILGLERQSLRLPANVKLFLTTGLLGGLSTFSTFSLETVLLLEQGQYRLAGGNLLLNVGLSICQEGFNAGAGGHRIRRRGGRVIW